jgi:hypothetical protein
MSPDQHTFEDPSKKYSDIDTTAQSQDGPGTTARRATVAQADSRAARR